MHLSRSKDQLIITAENTFDWMDLFDSGIDNGIMFEVDGDNLEFFCPDWEIYIDHNKPFDTLRIDDVKQIKSLDIMLAPNIEDMGGEGFYDVVNASSSSPMSISRKMVRNLTMIGSWTSSAP